MKGREIISFMHRDKMPDTTKVLENCIQQPVDVAPNTREKPTFLYQEDEAICYAHYGEAHCDGVGEERVYRRQRFSKLAASLVACLLFATVVFAVWAAYERFESGGFSFLGPGASDSYPTIDMGGSIIWKVVPEYSIDFTGHPETFHSALYTNLDADVLPFLLRIDYHQLFEYEARQMINEMLEGRVFWRDGSQFVLDRAFPGQGRNRVNPDTTLFDTYGNEIGQILGVFPIGSEHQGWETIVGIEITTKEQLEAQWGYRATFEDASAFLGRDVHLPTIEGFDPPRLNILSETMEWPGGSTGELIEFEITMVSVLYINSQSPGWRSEIMLYIESTRGENEEAIVVQVDHSMDITEYDVDGVAVLKLTFNEYPPSDFTWTHNGLVYHLVAPFDFAIEEVIEVIRAFLE